MLRNPEIHYSNYVYPLETSHDEQKSYKANGIEFLNAVQYAEYSQFWNKCKDELSKVIVDQSPMQILNPKAWIKNLSGKHTWTNREMEWYYAERVLVFGCDTERECLKWVSFINYICTSTD